MARAFSEAQERGLIAWDEPFDPRSILGDSPGGPWTFPYDISLRALTEIRRTWERGVVLAPLPELVTNVLADGKVTIAHAVLPLPGDRYLATEASVKNFRFSIGTGAPELAQDLAVSELGHELAQWQEGQPVARPRAFIEALLEATRVAGPTRAARGWRECSRCLRSEPAARSPPGRSHQSIDRACGSTVAGPAASP